MQFDSLASLWFALTLPAIVLLYLFKRKYVDTPVSSHLLWNRVLKELEANRPWQRLRNRLLMLVQLLAAALLVLAIMQPWIWSDKSAKAHVVIVLDRSASMSASAGSGGRPEDNRLEAAKQAILEWTDQAAAGSAITLIAMGESAELELSRETDRGRLREALSGLQPAHGRTAYKEAMSLASALIRADEETEVRLFTDGQFAEAVDGLTFDAPVTVVRIGGAETSAPGVRNAETNLGVSQFGVKADRSTGITAVASIRNWGEREMQAEAAFYAGQSLIEVRRITVEGGKQVSLYMEGLPSADWYKVELNADDPYRLDDVSYAFLAKERPKRVLLIGNGNLFLEKALQLAGAEVTKLSEDSIGVWIRGVKDEALPDVIVYASASIADPSSISEEWARFQSARPVLYAGSGYAGEERMSPASDYWIEEHPVMRYISLQDSHIAIVRLPSAAEWGSPVASKGGVPLIYAGTENGVPKVLFAFSFEQTDLPLRSEFPVLIQNTIEWLTAAQPGSLGRVIASGELDAALAPRTETYSWEPAEYVLSNRVAPEASAGSDGRLSPRSAPAEAGLYRLVERDENDSIIQSRWLAVTADPRESGLPGQELTFGSQPDEASISGDPESPQGSPHQLWRWLALLVLAVIVVEWGCIGVGLQFSESLYLLLLIPAMLYLVWVWRTVKRLDRWRRQIAIGLRAAVVVLLILALAGLQSFQAIERQAVIFIADRSDSMAHAESLAGWIRDAARAKEEDDETGVVSAGIDAVAEKSSDSRGMEHFYIRKPSKRAVYRLDSALQLAQTMMPNDASARMVLLSDGLENVGDVLRQGQLLRDRGIPVDVVPLPPNPRQDAAVESLKLPEKLYLAEQYAFETVISSTFTGTGVLRIYEDDQELSSQTVSVEPGENRFILHSLAKSQGLHRYRAELYMEGDEQSANNAAYAFSRVSGQPRVLLVEGREGEAGNLARALESGLVPYNTMLPEMLPSEITDYASYESIVLVNVPATRISEQKMEMIERAVRDYGTGLVMTGGDESFGLGGYYKTPIERALPVYMDLRGKREIPSLGLMLVIDKSGSMSGDKMRLAQEAAARTVELMREKDTLGVLAFDSSPWWVVEPELLKDPKKAMEQIYSIQADGGTEVYGAVAEAYSKLTLVEAQRKHIILLTDGQSATNQSYEALAADMIKNNITMSTVAIGDGADTQLLERIAKLANGRYYFTNDQSTVPAIFSREAVLVSRTYIVDQPFVPAVGQAAEWTSMFAGGVPPINAYIAVTAKETAEAALVSPEPDPLLARWQFGAGKTLAWTSDLTGKWAGDWVKWDRFPDIFSRMIKWTFPQFEASPYELTCSLEGGELLLHVTAGNETNELTGDLRAIVTGESLERREIVLEPTAPGEYSGRMEVTEPGAYLARIERAEAGEWKGGAETSGFVLPYSPEYRIMQEDGSALLHKLAELTGGRVLSLDRPEEVFRGQTVPKKHVEDLSRMLLIAALLLWVADIAVRRLQISWGRLSGMLTRRQRKQPRSSRPAAADPMRTLERLRQRGADRQPSVPAESMFGNGTPSPTPSSAVDSERPSGAPAGQKESAPPHDAEAADDRLNRLLAAKKRGGR